MDLHPPSLEHEAPCVGAVFSVGGAVMMDLAFYGGVAGLTALSGGAFALVLLLA
jgi:hypothetical protein